MTVQQRTINAEREEVGVIIKAEATERGTTRFIASTATPDSYNDIIVQSGWRLDRFLKNPVIPWAHSRWDLPVGKSIDTKVTEQALEIEVEWAPHAFAQDVKRMYDEQFLNAVSVGFRPLKWQYLDNGGVLFQEAELLEVSAVPIPANPDALALRSAGGAAVKAVDAWATRWLKERGQEERGELLALLKDVAQGVDSLKGWTARVEKEATDDLLAQLPQAQRLLVERLHKQYGVSLAELVKAAHEGEENAGGAVKAAGPVLKIKTA